MTKNIIITGASRGIGYEAALALANKKHQVLAVARTRNKLQQLKEQKPGHIEIYPADLTDLDTVNALKKFIELKYSKIDGIINNAGALINKPFTQLELSDWQTMLDSNLMTAIHLIQTLLPQMSEQSHILNISSMGGYQGSAKFPGLSAYSVAKGALSILTECLAVELKDRDIRSNALCLGMVQTEMLEEAFPGANAPVTAEQMGEYVANFAINGSTFYNGKILPVALQDPD